MKNIVRVVKNETPSVKASQSEYFDYLFDAKGKDGKKYYMIKLHQPSSKTNAKNFTNVVNNKWYNTVGTIDALSNFLDEFMDERGRVPGRIFIREFPEDAVPQKYRTAFLVEDDVDPAERYLKKAGSDDDAPVLRYYDARILTFKIYVRSNAIAETMEDVYLEHTNVDEVREWRASKGLSEDINNLDVGDDSKLDE